MARGKKHTPEQIVSLLRQIEVAVANGKIARIESKLCASVEFRLRGSQVTSETPRPRRSVELHLFLRPFRLAHEKEATAVLSGRGELRRDYGN